MPNNLADWRRRTDVTWLPPEGDCRIACGVDIDADPLGQFDHGFVGGR